MSAILLKPCVKAFGFLSLIHLLELSDQFPVVSIKYIGTVFLAYKRRYMA